MKVLFLKGLPGSGKTTWAKEFCQKNKDWVRVNRDDLRNMRGNYWIPKQEGMITDWEQACILSTLSYSKNVIVDAMNFNEKYLAALKGVILANVSDIVFESKFFDTPLEECIKNDLKRSNSVGKEAIMKIYNKYLKPEVKKYEIDPKLPRCIICDVDNTLLLKGDRGVYEFEKTYLDEINLPVRSVINNYREGSIIILSGREQKYLQLTIDTLHRYKVIFNSIFMRQDGDFRKDTVVKEELFNQHILNKYNVDFVIDDRLQVLELWWKKGLFVFNVNQGNIDF